MKKKILTVTDLKKSYIMNGKNYPVLQGINIEVNQGEYIAVMGPSGSGKTTRLNIVSGFDAIAVSYADRVIALSDGEIVKELLRTSPPRQFTNEILDFLKVMEVGR